MATKVYSLGPYDPNTTPTKMAELLRTIPKMEHKYPQVPIAYTAKQFQMSEELQQAILETDEKLNIPVPMRFCRNCFSFSRDLRFFSPEQQRSSALVEEYIYWKTFLIDLASAAESGCSFCRFMACKMFNDTGTIWVWSSGIQQPKPPLGCCALCEDELPEVKKAVARLRSFEIKYPDAYFGFIIRPTDFSPDLERYTKLRFLAARSNTGELGVKEILGFRRDLVIEIYNDPADFRPCLPLVQPDSLEPGSQTTQTWAKELLDTCLSSHEYCPKPSREALPTRVIKILDAENLMLVSENHRADFVALSYCWGGPQTFATTTQTIETMQEGFKKSYLPQTLQDAVTVTSGLGLKYLWIDSLCIIQDSDEDKLNELPNMGTYYGNAYFTLIAATGKCTDGFLAQKETCKAHPQSASFRNMLVRPFLCINEREKLHSHFCFFRQETLYDLSKEPVSKRAWTFQERVLSPRVLMYGQRVLWQCNSVHMSNGGCDDWVEQPWNKGIRQMQSLLSRAKKLDDAIDTPDDLEHTIATSNELYEIWYAAVREFSRRSLSFEKDKLPAISALANKFQTISGDQYLAGLWQNDMLRGLLWSTYPTVTLVKPPRWRAPSWSWASVNNPIIYRRLPGPTGIALAEIISCSVTPAFATASYGEVENASLQINGPVMMPDRAFTKTIMKRDNQVTHDDMRAVMMDMAIFKEDDTNAGFVNWEAPEKHILLLLYATMRNGADWNDETGTATVAGLVLEEIEDGRYERIGCFTTMGLAGMKYLSEYAPRKTIDIV